jgi:hypothetical protein
VLGSGKPLFQGVKQMMLALEGNSFKNAIVMLHYTSA